MCWLWEGGRWEEGGDCCYCSSASAEVRPQPLHHSLLTEEKGDGPTMRYIHTLQWISWFPSCNSRTESFRPICKRMKSFEEKKRRWCRKNQCKCRERLSLWVWPFSFKAQGQLCRPNLSQLPCMPPETDKPTVGYSMCVISADPNALKHWLSCDCTAFPE